MDARRIGWGALVKVRIYVEGGGDSKLQHLQCREAFSKLINKSGFAGRMPTIVAGGGRNSAYDMFKTAVATAEPNVLPMLLVDSEEPVTKFSTWEHLAEQDQWQRPDAATDDQAHLMATCMETWVVADRAAPRRVFGSALQEGALLPLVDLELRSRVDVQAALEQATRHCGRDRAYRKGRRSFQVLQELDPAVLKQNLAYFRRLLNALNRLLE